MVLMTLDHVRDYFHITASSDDPLNLASTTPALFFTRWITHFCAPAFIFLSGTSIFLQSQRKSNLELGLFVLKRGFWLIFVEWFVISLAWTFNPKYQFMPFQVIWAIGISMVFLGMFILIRMPFWLMVSLGFVLVFGHNILDFYEQQPDFKTTFWWDFLHRGSFATYEFLPGHSAVLVYPFPAWTGLMLLGFGLGKIFSAHTKPTVRMRFLWKGSLLAFGLFLVLRYFNLYGDPRPWSVQKDDIFTLLSFINLHKYPPSLLYLCVMLSLVMLALLYFEKISNWFTTFLTVFGKSALIFYILHIYLIHFLAAMLFFYHGHSFEEGADVEKSGFFLFSNPAECFGLPGTYAVWFLVLLLLYPVCKWYGEYKAQHFEKWWLSYL